LHAVVPAFARKIVARFGEASPELVAQDNLATSGGGRGS